MFKTHTKNNSSDQKITTIIDLLQALAKTEGNPIEKEKTLDRITDTLNRSIVTCSFFTG